MEIILKNKKFIKLHKSLLWNFLEFFLVCSTFIHNNLRREKILAKRKDHSDNKKQNFI